MASRTWSMGGEAYQIGMQGLSGMAMLISALIVQIAS
jgi:hypothetical protein